LSFELNSIQNSPFKTHNSYMTDAELTQTMTYLGWPVTAETFAQFQAALATVTAITGGEPRLAAALAQVIATETQIIAARNVVGSPYAQLLAEAQRNIYMLSNTLGIEVKQKVFR
jgi:hypothetical protein